AVIFGKKSLEIEPAPQLGGNTIEHPRMMGRAFNLFNLAANASDWEGAVRIYQGASREFGDNLVATEMKRILRGTLAYYAHDFDSAVEWLESPESGSLFRSDRLLLNAYLQVASDHWKSNEFELALSTAQAAVRLAPEDILTDYENGMMSYYNYGMIAAYLVETDLPFQVADGMPTWQKSLQLFIDHFDKFDGLPDQTLSAARQVLTEGVTQKPELLQPDKPDSEEIHSYQHLIETLN
ncbi:MAG: hypothetical protein AAGA96_09450, partial [Verrucomicrobiota bacterium]